MDINSNDYAKQQDNEDPLHQLRKLFVIPSKADLRSKTLQHPPSSKDDDEESTYLCGNSLGLQPTLTRTYFQQYLDTWATKGVFGHFKEVQDSNLTPWMHMDENLQEDMANIVGAKTREVAIMQTLTANLHLLMTSFYKPTKDRWKIILEGKAFPSDHVCGINVSSKACHSRPITLT